MIFFPGNVKKMMKMIIPGNDKNMMKNDNKMIKKGEFFQETIKK